MEKASATIQGAEIKAVYDLWKHKPKGLTFDDADVIIVTAKTKGGKVIRETFFTCLRDKGTFSLDAARWVSRLRRRRLASFLMYYGLAKDPESYNLREGIKDWKGKKIEIVKSGNVDYIYVP